VSSPYEQAVEAVSAAHARRRALLEQAQAFTGIDTDTELGTFDTVAPTSGEDLGNIYARLVALSAQRLRVLSAQLAAAHRDDPTGAFVYEKKAWNQATEELEVISEEPTALARLVTQESDRLADLLTTAVKLRLEVRSAEALAMQSKRIAAYVQAMAETAGLDWSQAETRRLAQRAIVAAEASMARMQRQL
jgi:hypothetical protein